jgi:hypothetical protein
LTSDATGTPQARREPAPDPSTTPDTSAPGPGPATARVNGAVRLWRRFRALGTGHKLTVVGLVVAGVPVITPWISAAYDALFGDDAIVMYVEQGDSVCLSNWIVAPGHEDLRKSVHSADDRALSRWERERKLTHSTTVDAFVGVRGNAGKAVQIRDVSITVTRRDKPLAGTVTEPMGCGGNTGPQILFVDLDTLPLNRPVPGRYLQNSPQQEDARKAAKEYARDRSAMSLPLTITTGNVYDLLLVGRTKSHYCEWKATLTWWDGEQVHKTAIDNDGAPFRVSAVTR